MKFAHVLALAGVAALALPACEKVTVNPDGSIGNAISSSVVISQVYAGGGNTGAPLRRDFIELFNKSNAPVNLSTWSVQYATAAGATWTGDLTPLTGTIAAGGYYLVVLDSGGAVGVALPASDVYDDGTNMAVSGGKVALVSNVTALSGTCPTGGAIIDFLGWGSATCSEGTKLGALANTTAALRKGGGCRDTDQNNLDFTIVAPSPRNSASPGGTCAPTGVGAGDPNPVGQGGTTLLTVTVTPGTNPPSTGLAVVANLTAIMGSAGQAFFDDGSNGDAFAGDTVFSWEAIVLDTVTTGAKTLPFSVSDAQARVDTSGSFVLNVVANAAPVASDDTFSVLLDTPRDLPVRANDTDADAGDFVLVAAITFQGSKGVAAIVGTGLSITYTPNLGAVGADAFGYRLVDSRGESDTATVNVSIVDAFAENDGYGATEETPLIVNAPGVLANDLASGNPPLTASVVTGPANGVLVLSSDGSFTYTGGANFFGPMSFTYRFWTGTQHSNVATVTIAVTSTQDPPSATNDSYAVTEDVTLTVNAAAGVIANDTDPDLDTLDAILVTAPTNGLLTLSTNGSFTYVPNLNYNLGDSFVYKVNDGTVDSGNATVTLNYTAVNDAPLAFADAYSLDEDTPIMVVTTGLVANDTDVEGSALSVVVVDAPDFGTFTAMAVGAFMYEPDLDFQGVDTMTYRANDGAASSAATATVTFTVAPINDAPEAVADAFSTDEDVPLVLAAAAGLLANDDDVDGDPILPIVDAAPANGTLNLGTDGSLTYTPAANVNGMDTFTYHLSDGAESSTIAAVTITLAPINDAPTIPAPISPASGEETSASDLVFSWSAATDVDGDAVEYRVQVLRGGTLYAQTQASGTTATIPGELPKGDFTWRVQADDGVADSGFSADVPFTIKGGGGDSADGLFGCSTTGARGPAGPTVGAFLALIGIVLARRRPHLAG